MLSCRKGTGAKCDRKMSREAVAKQLYKRSNDRQTLSNSCQTVVGAEGVLSYVVPECPHRGSSLFESGLSQAFCFKTIASQLLHNCFTQDAVLQFHNCICSLTQHFFAAINKGTDCGCYIKSYIRNRGNRRLRGILRRRSLSL